MCPDRETLAAYVDRRLPVVERDTFEAHLAACDACRREAVELWRLAKPRRVLQFRPSRGARWAWAVAASAAAAALLAVGLSYRRPQPKIEPRSEAARHIPNAPPEPKPTPEEPKPPAPVAKGTGSFATSPVPAPAPPIPVEPAPPVVEPPPAPPAPPKPAPPPVTVAAIATLERGTLVNGAAAEAGQPIRPDDLLSGAALLVFPDQTRIELESGTLRVASAQRLIVEKGAVKADVAKQPQPLVFETPHGSARVLGTVLRIQVDTLLRLEVEEGKVELRTKARSITVPAGRSATSSAMSLKALPKEESVVTAPKHEGPQLILGLDSLRVRGDEVLTFDYWVDAQAAQVNMHFWNSTRKMKHETVVTESAFGKWTHAVIKLADLGLQPGDELGNLFIQGTGGGPRQFLVDHLRLTRPYSLKPR